jgi:dTDP-L-rhamnose 4-epimerase
LLDQLKRDRFYLESEVLNVSQTVLVTGGLGFIGLNLTRELVRFGEHVVILDNLSPQIHGVLPQLRDPILESPQVKIIRGDVTDVLAVGRSIVGVDAIVHLAAETGTAQSMYEVAHYNRVNSQGTAILLDYLVNNSHQVKRFVLASSRSIYGEGAYQCANCGVVHPTSRTLETLMTRDWELHCPSCHGPISPIPTSEDAKIQPASIYAATKFAQEDLVRISCAALGIGATVLRFQNVYGAGQSLNNPYTGILSIFSTRIRRGFPLPIFEDGRESRDFVHVSDVVHAIRLGLQLETQGAEVLNVGSGVASSVFEVAQLLHSLLGGDGRSLPVTTGEFRVGDIRHCYADVSRLARVLAWTPQIDLSTGLREFSEWVLEQPLPEDQLDQANAELRRRRMMA